MSQDKKTPDAEDTPEAQADAARDALADAASEEPEADAASEESEADDTGADEIAAVEEISEETAEAAVERLEAEVAELDDRLLRAVAETENLRRRAVREREETGKYAVTGFAREMLAVVDNLRRALDSLPGRSPVGPGDDNGDENGDDAGDGEAGGEVGGDESLAGLVAGIEVTERELLAVFERHGIRRLDPTGEKFDPNFHQAMFEVSESGQPSGTVVQVMQAGYVIADRLLRPAMVGVAKVAEEETDADDAASHVDTEA